MKKQTRKLVLSGETIRSLERGLDRVVGGLQSSVSYVKCSLSKNTTDVVTHSANHDCGVYTCSCNTQCADF